MRRRQCRAGYAFVAPALVLTAIFFFLPMAFSLWWSFTKYNGVTEPKYVGFNNYADSTMTVVYYLVEKFHRLDLGHASAAAYLLVVFLAIVSAIQMRIERRES